MYDRPNLLLDLYNTTSSINVQALMGPPSVMALLCFIFWLLLLLKVGWEGRGREVRRGARHE